MSDDTKIESLNHGRQDQLQVRWECSNCAAPLTVADEHFSAINDTSKEFCSEYCARDCGVKGRLLRFDPDLAAKLEGRT